MSRLIAVPEHNIADDMRLARGGGGLANRRSDNDGPWQSPAVQELAQSVGSSSNATPMIIEGATGLTMAAIGSQRDHDVAQRAVNDSLNKGLHEKLQRAQLEKRQLQQREQQRVSIARAFVNRPLILLADEPTGNLDPQTSVGIMKLLDRINRTGTTVVMATHDRGIVDTMRRRVIELDRGQVVRDQARGVYE